MNILEILPFDSFSAEGYVPIAPAIINQRLSQLWEQTQEDNPDKSSFSRVSLGNLIVLSDESTHSRAEELILKFAAKRPSRTIHFVVDDDIANETQEAGVDGSNLKAELSIACNVPYGASQMVCWERINILIPRKHIDRATSIARSLVTSELSLALDLLPGVWSAEHHLDWQEIADFVFFDSFINRKKLTAKVRGQRGEYTNLFDLGYERDHPIREAIRIAFDRPETLINLANLRSIKIISPCPTPSDAIRAAYLTGWLQERLELKFLRRKSMYSSEFRFGDNTINISFERIRRDNRKTNHLNNFAAVFEFESETIRELSISPLYESDRENNSGSVEYKIMVDGVSVDRRKIDFLDDVNSMIHRISDPGKRIEYTDSLSKALELGIGSSPKGSLESSPILYRFENSDELVRYGAERFFESMRVAVRKNGRFTVALAGGSTPVALYHYLANSVYAKAPEWKDTYFFFGDERSVPPDHAESNYRMALETLLDPLGITNDRVFRMKGESDNLADAAQQYSEIINREIKIKSLNGLPQFDLILLGMGPDGHTASIFEDYPENEIGPQQSVANVYVGSKGTHRITLTERQINAAAEVIFMVPGAGKAVALYKTIVERSTPAAKINPAFGTLRFLIDRESSAQLNLSKLQLVVERW
ncbi:MAG: 6-phosphogluconolactonase [candidate division Zixibacteria bacterium]|nr:6-phosphogluconolactonase [candidate division Zixibacteria bacterium]